MAVLYIDNREKDKPVTRILESYDDLVYEYRQLKIGDFIIVGKDSDDNELRVCIERKTMRDYIQSIKDKRHTIQEYNMSTYFDLSIVMISGSLTRALEFGDMKRRQVNSAMMGTLLRVSPDGRSGRISVITPETEFDMAQMIYAIYCKVRDKQLHRLPEIRISKIPSKDRAVMVLAAFPMIGEERAKRLIEHFGDPISVFNAPVEELCKVDGIGKEIAKKMKGILLAEGRMIQLKGD